MKGDGIDFDRADPIEMRLILGLRGSQVQRRQNLMLLRSLRPLGAYGMSLGGVGGLYSSWMVIGGQEEQEPHHFDFHVWKPEAKKEVLRKLILA